MRLLILLFTSLALAQAPSSYPARTDNCVDGTQTDCKVGAITGMTGSALSFQGKTTDPLPFASGAPSNTAFTDPDFGTYMLIVTGQSSNTPTSSFNMKSNGGWDAFNSDHSILLVTGNGGGTTLYSINKARFAAHLCSPALPCAVKSRITSGPADNTHLESGGDWTFKHGEVNVLFEESKTGLIVSKLLIDTSKTPDQWTLTRVPYVNFSSDSPVPCKVLPADYKVTWSGVFNSAHDGSLAKAFGGGPPWHPGMVVTSESFIYPNKNNTKKNGFQASGGVTSTTVEPNWDATCSTAGSICTDGTTTWTNIGLLYGQGPGFDIVNYTPGAGCRHLNTRLGKKYNGTGVNEPSGALTTQDDRICTRMGLPAPCPLTDKLTLHESGQPFDSTFASISPTGAGSAGCIKPGVCSCAPTGINYQAVWNTTKTYSPRDFVYFNHISYKAKTSNTNRPPDVNTNDWSRADAYCYNYIWQVNSTIVNPCLGEFPGSGCSGHGEGGYDYYYKGDFLISHVFSLPSIDGKANPGTHVFNLRIPGDRHGSARNQNNTDSLPSILFNTEVPMSSTRYTSAGYAEDIALIPGDPNRMDRFNHNFCTGSSSEFPIQNCIGVMAQDGQVAAFGTDLMGTRGSRATGAAQCNKLRADYGSEKGQIVNINDKMLPVSNNRSQVIYVAMNNGAEDPDQLPDWNTCQGVGQTCLDGTVTWKSIGANDCRGDIVLIDLLSAHPLNGVLPGSGLKMVIQ